MNPNIVWTSEGKPLISICGWCPDAKERTRELAAQGYVVSHGLCPACEVKWVADYKASKVA